MTPNAPLPLPLRFSFVKSVNSWSITTNTRHSGLSCNLVFLLAVSPLVTLSNSTYKYLLLNVYKYYLAQRIHKHRQVQATCQAPLQLLWNRAVSEITASAALWHPTVLGEVKNRSEHYQLLAKEQHQAQNTEIFSAGSKGKQGTKLCEIIPKYFLTEKSEFPVNMHKCSWVQWDYRGAQPTFISTACQGDVSKPLTHTTASKWSGTLPIRPAAAQ